MKYIQSVCFFHLWEVVQIFQGESIFCKIRGVFIYQKISSGGTNLRGVHFYYDRLPLSEKTIQNVTLDPN